MSDVEVGLDHCLDKRSFHNILTALGVGYYYILQKDRISSGYGEEDHSQHLMYAPLNVFIQE